LVGLANSGFKLEGTLKDIHQGRILPKRQGGQVFSSDMEVTFGLGFGIDGMEKYMPLWFELDIPGPGTLVAPVRRGHKEGTRELISVSSFQKEYGTPGKWRRKAIGKTTQVQTLALKRLYREHCVGGAVLAGNAGADKWTSKERRLGVLPEHWVVPRAETPLMAWADRGVRVSGAAQGPAGEWTGGERSERTERVTWEQAEPSEVTRMLNSGHFEVVTHDTKDGGTTYVLHSKWAAGVSAYKRLACQVRDSDIRNSTAKQVVRRYIRGLEASRKAVKDVRGSEGDRIDPAPAGWGPRIEVPNLTI
jgi:hypothetical protein